MIAEEDKVSTGLYHVFTKGTSKNIWSVHGYSLFYLNLCEDFETQDKNVSKFDSLALPIPITLVSEQTFDERQLFNLVAAISAYTKIQKGTRARICSVMQSPWNPKMRRGRSVDSADMWQRVCTDGKKITGWGLVRRLGVNCNHHTIGGRVEDFGDLHFQTTSCLCPSHTSRTRRKKSWADYKDWGGLLGWFTATGSVQIYTKQSLEEKFSCFKKLLYVYPSVSSRVR